ncbi:MAG: aminotransferase class I/II-fold pyridoxal phosphate-dependent enzyme [Myxococcaceae bacterium]|nr:aminotransferase class I/II-fold pyridoxal phosphate-dependent enzyme [Myxococcaceae bacterium]
MAFHLLTAEVQAAMNSAWASATRLKHPAVTVEHLLLALLDEPTCVAALTSRGAHVGRMRDRLGRLLETRERGEGEPKLTVGVERVLHRAANKAEREHRTGDGADLLDALLREEESAAWAVLHDEGVGHNEAMTVRLQRPAFELDENGFTKQRVALQRTGVEVVDLTVANPTSVGLSPTGVVLPAVDVYEPDSFGTQAARDAVSRFTGVPAERLLLSASTSEAYAWLFKLLNGDVLVPAPCYPLLEHLAELEQVRVHHYPLRYEGRWHTDSPLIVNAATAQTRAVVAVSPGNPTGTYLGDSEAHALAQLCAARGWALIIDEVFAEPSRSCARHEWPCLTFTLGGLSKSCGLPQLKLAWCGVHGPGAEAALERLGLIADTYLSVSSPVQAAAGELLEKHAAAFRARVAERCAVNRAQLQRVLPATWQLLESEGGWSAVIRVPQDLDEEARCLAALGRGVAVHPGYFYDFPSGAHLVLSLLAPPDVFAEGVSRLTREAR